MRCAFFSFVGSSRRCGCDAAVVRALRCAVGRGAFRRTTLHSAHSRARSCAVRARSHAQRTATGRRRAERTVLYDHCSAQGERSPDDSRKRIRALLGGERHGYSTARHSRWRKELRSFSLDVSKQGHQSHTQPSTEHKVRRGRRRRGMLSGHQPAVHNSATGAASTRHAEHTAASGVRPGATEAI